MLPTAVALSFFTTCLILALVPGPDVMFLLTQSLLGGRRRGVTLALGLCSGLIVHTAIVATGLAAVFAASPIAFTVLKIIGAAYLLYLAWGALRTRIEAPQTATRGEASPQPLRGRKLYVRGIVMNLTNPKVVIFTLAFLPPFADPARGALWVQFVQLGALFIAASFIVFATVALAAGDLGQKFLRSQRAQWALTRIAGILFAVLALWLLLGTAPKNLAPSA